MKTKENFQQDNHRHVIKRALTQNDLIASTSFQRMLEV